MGGILVGVLAAVCGAHQIQDLIIVVLPVCPVQAQSMVCFWPSASKKSKIGMTGLTSCSPGPDLERFCEQKKSAMDADFFVRGAPPDVSLMGLLSRCFSGLCMRYFSFKNAQNESYF
ncbi:hypothetical protein PspS34_24590 [Pseudomonas sp. S34]|nr:hypothetical protein PspS34_24590 [Pseudomonas sp. S34]